MSGGGYDPPEPTPGGGPDGIDCHRLAFVCSLTSVDAAVLAGVSVHEVCDVRLVGTAMPAVTIEVHVRSNGAKLGGIVDRWADLHHCLDAGVDFEAELLTVTAPVRVLVRAVP